jgi:predicted phosphodiesterase
MGEKMKSILALSDIHLENGSLPNRIIEKARKADLVLYAGILSSQPDVKKALETACSNDPKKLHSLSGEIDPEPWDWEKIKIRLVNNLFHSNNFDENMAMSIADIPHTDLLVIGQIDQPIIVWGKKETYSQKSHLIVCPGSSRTTSIYIRSFPSAAWLDVTDGKITSAKLIRIASVNFQEGWRFCNKCYGLFFATNEGKSACPAGGKHDGSKSGHYYLAKDDPNAAGQDGWRLCRKCHGLFFADNAVLSTCPGGGRHEVGSSATYKVIHNDPNAPGNDSWRLCSKCQGLFFARTDGLGLCPKGMTGNVPSKEQHSISKGNIYRVERD